MTELELINEVRKAGGQVMVYGEYGVGERTVIELTPEQLKNFSQVFVSKNEELKEQTGLGGAK